MDSIRFEAARFHPILCFSLCIACIARHPVRGLKGIRPRYGDEDEVRAMVPGYIEAEDDPLQMEIQGDKRQSLVVLLCSSCCDVTPSFCTECEGDATLSAFLEQSFTELLLGLKLPSAFVLS